ncbi:MAG: hypothetical protein JNK69_07665 [Saprospiraceae bacterium]|nr:hypothetical protein [Candidatus Vicinibacter proximus]MBL7823267.1 hypothetical protein [Saprospiraceae bacterium]MCC6841648.1 hypothetical protein [Saprospiraceae bacterium]HRG34371.1 hypothetical protein [Saprospiraceae bacterium]
MITTQTIDQTIARFESQSKDVDDAFEALENDHQELLDVLAGSNAESLTDDEMDYLLFLFAVIYDSYRKSGPLPNPDLEQIEKTEDSVWEIINDKKDLASVLDHYYEHSAQHDLIEFIELSVGPDDENEFELSDSGRTILLAALLAEVELLGAAA